ncbi:hypothetical protein IW261DRAFT_1414008 [Armillaria novae-zelandiae]|uniref:Uncharacterized protein n=1 Tax=Armillaria novae-zelandiae TaxID=153914 RepID=A0AA39UGI7_9AGAR|nr:hypothetical protein IW261DRAFT_1414008 [Armillaria novae-zelandiae]
MFSYGAEIEEIEHQILSLEEREKELAAQYGMVGDIDSVEVFDEAKRRAFAKLGPNVENDLRALNKLLSLRLQLAQLRRSYAVSPPVDECNGSTELTNRESSSTTQEKGIKARPKDLEQTKQTFITLELLLR